MNSYHPEQWRELYIMLGGAAAALIGLLFVAMSLHLDHIMKNGVFRWRARNNLLYLLTLLVISSLILIPQPVALLGAELIAINAFWSRNALVPLYKRFVRRNDLGGLSVRRAFVYTGIYCCGALGGALLIYRPGIGMYVVAAAYLAFLSVIILNAWEIMLGAWNADAKKSSKSEL